MSESVQRPEIQGFSIVAFGAFNPAIFQPLWFSGNNLITEDEARNASIEIIHGQVAMFATEWLSIQVTQGRFVAATTDPTKSRVLRDLVLGTFRILEHTPIEAFGFNANQHFRMSSIEDWHAFGHHYAPKESWRDIVLDPGMQTLVIRGKREGSDAMRVEVRVEPSAQVHPGVFIQVNQHYNWSGDEERTPRDRMVFFLNRVQDSWEGFTSYGDRVAQHLLNQDGKAKD